jgi:hypothetical protein
MKKVVLVLVIIGLLGSCTKPTVETKSTHIVTGKGNNPLTVVVIEGCEYLEYDQGHHYSLCHKGNCSNPIHKK